MSRDSRSATPERLGELVRAFPGVGAVVLADLVLDEFRYGEPARVSREAPVLILSHRRTDRLPGGGANAVANLRALGARPVPVGRVGEDASGAALRAAFAAAGIPATFVWSAAGFATPTKSRILAGGAHSVKQQVVRIDEGEPAPLTAAEEEALLAALDRALEGAGGMLISDYGYGLLHPGNIPGILERARRRGVPVIVDSRSQLGHYRGITAAAPNLEEAESVAGMRVGEDPARLAQAGRKLLELTDARAVMVTLGSRGLTLFTRDEEPVHLPVFGTDEVADVTGAGDTVAAAFTAAVLAGGSFLEAATLANVAAGLVVMKRGTATVSPAELARALGAR